MTDLDAEKVRWEQRISELRAVAGHAYAWRMDPGSTQDEAWEAFEKEISPYDVLRLSREREEALARIRELEADNTEFEARWVHAEARIRELEAENKRLDDLYAYWSHIDG